jgi:fucose permease
MLVRSVSWNHVYTTTLVILVPVLIYLVFLRFPETNKDSANNKLPIGQMVKDKKIWLIVGTLGFCGVLEMGMANWLVNFLQEVRGISVDQSSLYMTFFFVTFMLGRLFGGHIAERLGYAKIILYFAIISIVIFACGMVLNNSFIFLFSCIGFFVSIMFPTIMSIIMKEYPSSTSSVMGFIISINGGINMTFNWIIGKTNDLLNVNMGFGSLIIYAVLIVVFVIPLGKRLTYDKKGNEEMIIYNSN